MASKESSGFTEFELQALRSIFNSVSYTPGIRKGKKDDETETLTITRQGKISIYK